MSELDFQKALASVLTDHNIRKRLCDGSLTSPSEIGLSLEAVERIAQIDPQRLDFFAQTIEEKRIGEIIRFLPMTSKLLGQQLHHLLTIFNRQRTRRPTRIEDFVLSFALFLEQQFSLNTIQPRYCYLPDILIYEAAIVELYNKAEIGSELRNPPELLQLRQAAALPKLTPRRSSNCRVVNANYDLPAIFTIIAAGSAPADFAKQPRSFLLYINADSRLNQDIINDFTLIFLDTCNGSKSLDVIIKWLATKFDLDTPAIFSQFLEDCIDLSESLAKRGVITFAVDSSGNDLELEPVAE
jgi:hypothetical protein